MRKETQERGCFWTTGNWTLAGLALSAFAMAPAAAQTVDSPQDKDATVQRLVQKIEELEASQKRMQDKLDRLSAAAPSPGPASAPVAAPAPAPVASAVPALPDISAQTDTSGEDQLHRLGPVEFRGFTDFDYGRPWFAQLPAGGLPGSTNSFGIGDFDLFTNTHISEHWNLLGELLITSDFTNEFGAEIDRLMLTYTRNDYFKISFGKFNTAIGFYDNEFHRAHFFQTGISRPVMYSDEDDGGILPVHSIGVTATGMIPSGQLGLHWVAEVANGRGEATGEPIQNFVDENNGKAVNLALYARPEWLRGFQAGFSIYHDALHPTGLSKLEENIISTHAVYVGNKFEWLNEAAVVRHALPGGPVFRTLTSYTQVSRAFGKYRPYFRYDYQNIPATEPILGALGRLNGPSIGVLRHLSSYVILKMQYGRLSERGLNTTNDAQAQLAVAF